MRCMVSFCLIANEESLWHDIMLQKALRVSVETVVLGPAELFDLHCKALTTRGVHRCSSSLYNMHVVCLSLAFSETELLM